MDVTQEAWERELLVRLEDPARYREAVAMVNDPALLAAAAGDRDAAERAVRGMSCLAWHDAEDARAVGRQLKEVTDQSELGLLFERAGLDILASRAYEAAGRPPLPPELMALLSTGAFSASGRRHDVAGRLRNALLERPQEILDQLGAALHGRRALQLALERRVKHGVPAGRTTWKGMAGRLRPAFHTAMEKANTGTGWSVTAFLFALAGFLWLVVIGFVGMAAGKESPVATGLVLVMFGSMGALWWFLERRFYRHRIRLRLMNVMARVGVTFEAVRGWIGWSPGRFGLWRLAPWLDNDQALKFAGLLAAMAAVEADDAVDRP